MDVMDMVHGEEDSTTRRKWPVRSPAPQNHQSSPF